MTAVWSGGNSACKNTDVRILLIVQKKKKKFHIQWKCVKLHYQHVEVPLYQYKKLCDHRGSTVPCTSTGGGAVLPDHIKRNTNQVFVSFLLFHEAFPTRHPKYNNTYFFLPSWRYFNPSLYSYFDCCTYTCQPWFFPPSDIQWQLT